MDIVVSSDDNYSMYLGVTILSIFKNNRNVKSLTVHILDNGIKSENKNKIMQIVNEFKRKIKFYELDKYNKILKNKKIEGISIAAYSRLFLCEILEGIDKVIYMDVDSLVLGSLEDLWNEEINNYLIAGVQDTVPVKFKLNLGLTSDFKYINSGFLVLNLEKMRKEKFITHALKILEEKKGEEIHHDQGVINKICENKILYLEPKYNVITPFYLLKYNGFLKFYKINDFYSAEQIQEAKDNPIFVHFTPAFTSRPWVRNCKHPLTTTYLSYAAQTPWKEKEFTKKDTKKLKAKIIEYIVKSIINIF